GGVGEVWGGAGGIKVHAVTCVVDCGVAVNPAGIAAQMESGILYGLSAALMGRITVKGGRPQESNFDDYRILRMPDAPRIETVIVPSPGKIGGAGEPGAPPTAPAVANAVVALTRHARRTLPL